MHRLGIFGGTFNPPHNGHIYIAHRAMELAGLDKMIFVPCGTPPHKSVWGDVDALCRFEMTRLAIVDYKEFEISDLEVVSQGPNYTAETLKKFQDIFPGSQLCFVVGGDSLRDMEKWYHPEKIFGMAEVVAVSRGGVDDRVVEEKSEYYRKKYNAQITTVGINPVEISSSQIRDMIAKGQDVSEIIDPKVLKYIQDNKIYRDSI